jgi:hypothetical protein
MQASEALLRLQRSQQRALQIFGQLLRLVDK